MTWRKTVRQSDAAAVHALVRDTGFFSQEEQLVAVELVDERLAKGAASGYEFVFADAADKPGELLAYACYGPVPATESSYDLYWIAVAPSQQGKGLGGSLLREVERCAMQSGASQMFLDTSGRAQYAPTRAFYLRMGYRVAGTLEDFFAAGDDKVIFAKRLGQHGPFFDRPTAMPVSGWPSAACGSRPRHWASRRQASRTLHLSTRLHL